mgnify:CR=1 FL=1
MIPKIIHLTAKTKRLSAEEKILWKKNQKVLNDWQFKLYDDADNLAIVKQYFPEHLDKYNSISKGVAKADIVRCMYMYVFGGLYVDTDYRFLASIPVELMKAQCVIPAEQWLDETHPYLGNCIFLSEAKYPFWEAYVNHVFDSLELSNLKENRIIEVTGPGGITDFYMAHRSEFPELVITQKNVFHPLLKAHHLWVKTDMTTVGVHFCFGSWRSKKTLLKYIFRLRQLMQACGLFLR